MCISKMLENNPIGMLLLYAYIHIQRPEACSISSEKTKIDHNVVFNCNKFIDGPTAIYFSL